MATMADEEGDMSHQAVEGDGGEWTSLGCVEKQAQTARRQSGTSIAEAGQIANRGQTSTGSEFSTESKETLLSVTVLTSLEAETKSANGHGSHSESAEHVVEKNDGEETEDDIALLEYLSGTESDCYEVDRASRKSDDADNQMFKVILSPRSKNENLGTPDSPDEPHVLEGSHLHPTASHRMREVPRQALPRLLESLPRSRNVGEEEQSTKASQMIHGSRPLDGTRPKAHEGESEWIACCTEDGLTYYYNQHTHESQWTNPTVPGVRIYVTDDLFAAVSEKEPSNADLKQLNEMLQSGMDLNAVNAEGLTPLHVACKLKNEQAATLLIYYGANMDAKALPDDATSLILACRVKSTNVANLLVESNATLLACDSDGNTALHVAAITGDEELVMCLLRGCDDTLICKKNGAGETALHIAAKLGYLSIAQRLLAYGASVKDEDFQGRTPLILGILENHVECVQLLQSVEDTASENKAAVASNQGSDDGRKGDIERDALSVLHSYLFHVFPQPSTSESQTICQLVDEVRDQIESFKANLQSFSTREQQYRKQMKIMSSTLAASAEELQKEKTLHGAAQNQLVVRELELNASRVSHQALTSRCDLLESIARNAQERLGRERLERTNYEESMQETLQYSLQENAKVIGSCQQLQANWNERQQLFDLQQSRPNSQEMYTYPRDQARSFSEQELSKDSFHRLQTEESTGTSSGTQPIEHYLSDYQTQYQQGQHAGLHHSLGPYRYAYGPEIRYAYGPEIRDAPPPQLDTDDSGNVNGTLTPLCAPTRIGAVWNHFFENVGYASDPNSSNNFHPPSHKVGQPTISHPVNALVFDAIRKNNVQKLQRILMEGVSPNQRDVAEKGTPLHLACELGDIDSVMLLNEFGAELEARDEAGNSPLLAACFQGNFDCVKFLLQNAVNNHSVNENGDSALHLAAWDGSISCVLILLDYGVDPMATNRFGLTALGNIKTRSPMRHKFDDLPETHPIRRTLMALEDAEHQRLHLIEGQSTSTEDANDSPPSKHDATIISPKTSWTQWLLGFRGAQTNAKEEKQLQKSEAGDTNTSTTYTEHEGDSEDADAVSTYEDSISSETQYEPLVPPPDVEEGLRRLKAKQLAGGYEQSGSAAQTFPITQQELLKHVNRTPSSQKISTTHPPVAPTRIHARYVDAFIMSS